MKVLDARGIEFVATLPRDRVIPLRKAKLRKISLLIKKLFERNKNSIGGYRRYFHSLIQMYGSIVYEMLCAFLFQSEKVLKLIRFLVIEISFSRVTDFKIIYFDFLLGHLYEKFNEN